MANLANTDRLLTAAEVAALPGAPTYRQLDHWTAHGRLTAEGKGGHGNPRRWPASEIAVAMKVARLVRAGFGDLGVAFRVARGESQVEIAPGIRITMKDDPA